MVIHNLDGTSDTEFTLTDDGGRSFALDFAEPPLLATGDRVRVFGHELGDRFLVEDFSLVSDDDDLGSSSMGLTGNGIRTRSRVAMLLVHSGSPDSLTAAGMRSRLFTNSNSTASFYNENSYNLHDIQGDVFGWLQVPAMQGCDYRTLATNAQAAARNAGIDLSGYTQIAYYFPRNSQCGWSGLAFVGTPSRPARESWYNGSSGCVVLAHEIMHNYGAGHARSYSCTRSGTRVAIGTPSECTFSEYGDPFDPMGGGCWHTGSYQKGAQGWFGKCNAVTVTSDIELDIVPTALASNEIQTVRVPMSGSLCPSGLSSCFYYVEYRQPVGIFDSQSPSAQVHQGVILRVAANTDFAGTSRPTNPYLLDLTPTSSAGHRDPALTTGQTFTDPNGIQISLLSRNSESARVRIRFPGGGAGNPTCIDGSQPGTTPPPPPPPPSGNCAAGETEFEGGCYATITTTQGYDASRASCQARGAGWDLAEIGGAAENNFISGLIGNVDHWLGATDRATEGRWVWESGDVFWTGGSVGSPVAGRYANFVSGEPNNGGGNSDCLRMIAGGGWRDIQCNSNYRAVCEQRPVTCGAGEVEYGGHCYFRTPSATTYDVALAQCESRGEGWTLAQIDDPAENQFVSSLIGNVESWLGGNDRVNEGTWVWERSGQTFWTGGLTGGPTSGMYANFVSGEPNDLGNSDCLRMLGGGGWRDIQCGSSYRAVCEYAP